MHKKTRINFLTIAVAPFFLLMCVPVAWAQAGSFEIGVGAGLMEFDDNIGGETEFRFDLRGGYFFTDQFSVEGQLLRASSVFDLEFTALMVNGVYHFGSSERFVPYVLAGIGATQLEFSIDGIIDLSADDEGTALQAAVGTRFYLGDSGRRSLRLELSALTEDSFSESSTNITFTGGFIWRFGS